METTGHVESGVHEIKKIPIKTAEVQKSVPQQNGGTYSSISFNNNDYANKQTQQINAWQAAGSLTQNSGNEVLSGIGSGASMGATIGSIFPGVGTIIGGGAGALIGGIMGIIKNNKNKKAQEEAQETAKKNAEEQREWQEKMMKEQAEINKKNNSYGEKVKQMKEAGLNPAQLMSGQSNSSSTSAGSGATADTISPYYQDTSAGAQALNADAVSSAASAAAQLANTEKTGVEAAKGMSELSYMQSDKIVQYAEAVERINKMIKDGGLSEAQATRIQSLLDAELKNLNVSTELTNKELGAFDTKFDNEQANIQADTALKKAQERLTSQEINNKKAEERYTNMSITQMRHQIRNIDADTALKGASKALTEQQKKELMLVCDKMDVDNEVFIQHAKFLQAAIKDATGVSEDAAWGMVAPAMELMRSGATATGTEIPGTIASWFKATTWTNFISGLVGGNTTRETHITNTYHGNVSNNATHQYGN